MDMISDYGAAVTSGLCQRDVVLPAAPGTARIAVVADTHSRPDPRAIEFLAAWRPDVLLHAGDIGDLAVLDRLAPLAPSMHVVRGNIDDERSGIPEMLVLRLLRPPPEGTAEPEGTAREVLRILLLHIAVAGPKLRKEARAAAMLHHVDMVVCGHSHVPFVSREGRLTVFNPGSIGPRRFALPIALGCFELAERLVVRHIDCETGAVWKPPSHAPLS